MPPKPARRGNQSNNLDPKECSTLRYPLPSLRDGRLLTGRKRDFLDKQRAVMRGSPRRLLPAVRPPACSQIVHYNHQEEVFPVNQTAYNNDSGGGAGPGPSGPVSGGNNGLCDVTTDGRTKDALLSSSRTHLSLAVSGMKANRVVKC